MVRTVWKSVLMACKVPTASSSSMLRPTTNAIPATPTAPRGEFSVHKEGSIKPVSQREKTLKLTGVSFVCTNKIPNLNPQISDSYCHHTFFKIKLTADIGFTSIVNMCTSFVKSLTYWLTAEWSVEPERCYSCPVKFTSRSKKETKTEWETRQKG